ncbi:hypothetical protein GN956_G19365 [Arapaima gigas]
MRSIRSQQHAGQGKCVAIGHGVDAVIMLVLTTTSSLCGHPERSSLTQFAAGAFGWWSDALVKVGQEIEEDH